MTTTIELPTGKIINLERFVALFPDEKTIETKYLLIMAGHTQPISLDESETASLKKHLQLNSQKNSNGSWDRETQIRQNQPKIELLRKRINRLKQECPSPEKEAAFEAFKKTIDAYRPEGQKLYDS